MKPLVRSFEYKRDYDYLKEVDNHKGWCGHAKPCCIHSVVGTVIEGSPNVFCEKAPVTRLGDKVKHTCPHCGDTELAGFIDDCANNSVFCNGISVAIIEDHVRYLGGEGNLMTGSKTVFISHIQ